MNGTSMGSLFANRMGGAVPTSLCRDRSLLFGAPERRVIHQLAQYPTMKTTYRCRCGSAMAATSRIPHSPVVRRDQEAARKFWRVTVNKSTARLRLRRVRIYGTAPVSATNPDVAIWEETVPATSTQVVGRKIINIFTTVWR